MFNGTIPLGLTESAKVQCRKYSRGMALRLAGAVSVIGDPHFVIMDEPTTGVDPISKRQFWDIIRALNKAGRSVILTSHNMGECEVLCHRLAIMVNGEFHCIGRVTQLKSKYAKGFTIIVKIVERPRSAMSKIPSIIADMRSKIPSCTFKDSYRTTLQFSVDRGPSDLIQLYEIMEVISKKWKKAISEYTVQPTALEEIFKSFSKLQEKQGHHHGCCGSCHC